MKLDRAKRIKIAKVLLGVVWIALLVGWLVETPPGLLGKADAVGYSVCHRIDARSFHLGDRAVPLCARCSGMYLGALLALVYQARLGRKMGMPSMKFLVFFVIAFSAFAVDGVNSYVHLIPGITGLYTPTNFLRLITGTGVGIAMAGLVAPIFNQTMWSNPQEAPLLDSWRQLVEVLVLAAVLDAMVMSENPLLLYPLALLSAATVLLLLTLIYSILWVVIFKQENQAQHWRQVAIFLLAGLTTALAQVAVIDFFRFLFTGTWGGFKF